MQSPYLIRSLKAKGQKLEAGSRWLHLWNRPRDWVFNDDFEKSFVRNGFD